MKYSESLKKQGDFSRVYTKGKSKANDLLVLYVLPNGREINRLGISVSKKVGNSVVRHTITRRIREIYRLSEESFLKGFDFIVIARGKAKGTTYAEIRSALLCLAKGFKVLKDNE